MRRAPILVEQNLFPTKIEERRGMLDFELTKEKVKKKHLMHFTRQLAVFVKAGIPITDALITIGDETEDVALRRALGNLVDDLRNGGLFSAAAATHPEVFPDYYVGILQSAELTGQLDTALESLADYLEREIDTRSKVVSALVVPDGGHGDGDGHRADPGRLRAAPVQAAVRGVGRRPAAADPDDAVLLAVLHRPVVHHRRVLHGDRRHADVPVQAPDRASCGRNAWC